MTSPFILQYLPLQLDWPLDFHLVGFGCEHSYISSQIGLYYAFKVLS